MRDSIGDRFRARRVSLGWSKAEAARQAGIARPYYSRIEDGKQPGTVEALKTIGAALGMTFAEVFDAEAPAPRDEDVTRSIDAAGELDIDPPQRWMSLSLRAAEAAPAHDVKAGDVLIFEGEDDPHPGQLVLARRGRTYRVGRYRAQPAPALEPWSEDGDTILLDERWEVLAVAVRQWREL